MTTKSHLATLAHYPSLLVSSTAKTALMEVERLEAALAIAVEALEAMTEYHREAPPTATQMTAVAMCALIKIREMK